MKDQTPFGNRHPILSLLLLPFLIVAAAIAKLFDKPVVRTPDSVVSILARRISEVPDWQEWDDFICVPIQDAALDQIRIECRAMMPDGQTPPGYISAADRVRIQKIIESLQRCS